MSVFSVKTLQVPMINLPLTN